MIQIAENIYIIADHIHIKLHGKWVMWRIHYGERRE